MSSCLLVESDPLIAIQVTAYLAQTALFDPPIVCSTAREASIVLADHPVDLIVLDTSLPDLTGIEWLENLVYSPPVIVLSDHAEEAAACYNLDMVVDFLLKPVPYLRFLQAIQRALLLKVGHGSVLDASLLADEKWTQLRQSGRQLKRVVLDEVLYTEE